ncbi:hypothetical protein [Minwuia thermotolerans]|uniref:Uncharacterized protein n=1 Tax=Minwuia thermotolerans TaxID=2056226 RepID=A0A2M9G2L7_9PROT|nr:hypothetical protein [Minwuia thermotolerans]PJK29926.1 hypothetical protein CVT23_09150 [Minwuia thermotolerans]
MRVNVYAEEMTDRIEIVEKVIDGQTFTGLRIYLALPVSYKPEAGGHGVRPVDPAEDGQAQQLQGPFMHRPGDDDSAAVTFWGKRDLRETLKIAMDALDRHYARTQPEGPGNG